MIYTWSADPKGDLLGLIENIVRLLIFLIPPYVANSIPVILGGGMPIDMGKRWKDGRYVFGKSKTVRGFVSGVAFGTVAGIIISYIYPLPFFHDSISQTVGAFTLSLGTMLGDLIGSFIKRRKGIEEGKPFFLDTWLFIVFAIILTYPFLKNTFFSFFNIAFILLLTVALHPAANKVANVLGMKRVPW